MNINITGRQKLFGDVFCGTSFEQSSALLCLSSLASTSSYVYGVPKGKGIDELIESFGIFLNIQVDGLGSAFVEPYEKPVDFKEYSLYLDQSLEKVFLIPLLIKRGLPFSITVEKEYLYLYKKCFSLLSILDLNFTKKSEYKYFVKPLVSRKIEKTIKVDFSSLNFFESFFSICLLASLLCEVIVSNFPEDPAIIEALEFVNLFNKEKNIFKLSSELNEASISFLEGFEGFKANVKFNFEEAGFYSFLTAGLEGRLSVKNVSLSDIFPLRVRISNWGLQEEQGEDNNLKLWYESSHLLERENIKIEAKEFPGFILSWSLCATVYFLSKKIPFSAKLPDYPFIKDLVIDLNRMGASLESQRDGSYIILVSKAKGSLSGRKILLGDRKIFLPLLMAAFLSKGKSSISNFNLFIQYFPSVSENLKNISLID